MVMTRNNERGVALVITLFLMASLSALAVSLMFLSQTETSASRNYKTMSQARYAGEAGVHRAMNYLMSTAYANTMTTAWAAGLNSGATSSPVRYSGNPVVLSSTATDSNYPDNAIKTAFAAAAQGDLAAGTGTIHYAAVAKLLSMVQVTNVYGATGPRYIQTWQITATGSVPVAGAPAATVEVSATLERDVADANTFAVFATGLGCGAIDLQGNVQTASYDSSGATGTGVADSGGNVGTNGNMTIGGHVDVHGSLSSPRTGIGTCTEGANMTALTQSGAATVDGNNLVQLPQAMNYDTPDPPSPMPPQGTMNAAAAGICTQIASAQSALTMPPATCGVSGTGSNTTVTIDPMGRTIKLGDITGNFVLKGGTYNVNSVGSGNLSVLPSGAIVNPVSNVVLNIAGKCTTCTGGNLATVFDLAGNAVVNASMDPARLQIVYGGSGAIEMTGGSQGAFMIYAPNAAVTTHGNSDIWGSVLARQVTSAGTPRFIYDRNLQSKFFTMGNWVMSSFSWKKY